MWVHNYMSWLWRNGHQQETLHKKMEAVFFGLHFFETSVSKSRAQDLVVSGLVIKRSENRLF